MKRTTVALATILLVGTALGAKREAFPYTAAVMVVQGDTRLPASLVEDLQRGIIRELTLDPCFVRLESDPEAADFVVRLFADEFEELTRYDASISERATAFDPNVKNMLTARIQLKAEMQMVQRRENLLVRTEAIRSAKAVRPVNLSQDETYAREEARRQMVVEVIFEARNAICRGSPAKLEKQIDKARRAATSRDDSR